jgi:uncharacterized membrane protein
LILYVPPGSPWWIVAGATLLLVLHIGGGTLGIVTGTAALLFAKGSLLHRLMGNVFAAAMLTATFIGAVTSPFLSIANWGNAIGGTFAFYMVATGWATVKRKEGSIGSFEIIAFFFALAAAAGCVYLARAGIHSPGTPEQAVYIAGAVAAWSALCDLKVIVRGGIAGAPRIARHLWRMCAGTFTAFASFFLGQQRIMPAFIQGSPLLIALAVAPLGFLFYWLIRVRLTKWYRQDVAAPLASGS